MSPMFIIAFKKKHKCPRCSASKLTGYSVCQRHLSYAKYQWRRWSARRFSKGLCHSCDRQHIPSEQRCMPHTRINQKRCQEWTRNKYHSRKRDGLCVDCPTSNPKPTTNGLIWCSVHHERHRINCQKRTQLGKTVRSIPSHLLKQELDRRHAIKGNRVFKVQPA